MGEKLNNVLWKVSLLCIFMVFVSFVFAGTSVPQQIGRCFLARDASGNKAIDGEHTINASIYNAKTAGSLLFSSDNITTITSDGVACFNVSVGVTLPQPFFWEFQFDGEFQNIRLEDTSVSTSYLSYDIEEAQKDIVLLDYVNGNYSFLIPRPHTYSKTFNAGNFTNNDTLHFIIDVDSSTAVIINNYIDDGYTNVSIGPECNTAALTIPYCEGYISTVPAKNSSEVSFRTMGPAGADSDNIRIRYGSPQSPEGDWLERDFTFRMNISSPADPTVSVYWSLYIYKIRGRGF